MKKILGIDLGSNSIGLSVRYSDKGLSFNDQLKYFKSIVFKSGIGKNGSDEFSFAAQRRGYRSRRRLYQARKYRIWETLTVLIEYDLCPLTKEGLDQWRVYKKEQQLTRKYPVDAPGFEQWVRLDFDGDGIPDYSSPYQLREELATLQLDFSQQINRYKLGRALYHIAQRRGFKSSKGETIKEQETDLNIESEDLQEDITEILKKSEEKKAKELKDYQVEHGCPTVGCAFALLEREGIRVRNSEYKAVRSQYRDEVKYIFQFQQGLDTESDLYLRIYSDKKNVGTIFYKRPLRSQKGTVGKCTLEPSKPRCPISHPEFETFCAYSFINNIKYRRSKDSEWVRLSKDQADRLYNDCFLLARPSIKFEVLRQWIEKDVEYPLSYSDECINYKDKTSVSGAPISARFKKLLGKEWYNVVITTDKTRTDRKGNEHLVSYTYEDLWHVCFSADDAEDVEEFALSSLKYNNQKALELVRIWGAMQQGYARLSLKAIRNINSMLIEGLIYSEAALLAKIPEIIGSTLWTENKELFIQEIGSIIRDNRYEKQVIKIANSLIATYNTLQLEERFGYKNIEYQLDESDWRDIEKYSIESIGDKTWASWEKDEQDNLLTRVGFYYQKFFQDSKRNYIPMPKLINSLRWFLSYHFDFLHCENESINPNKNLPCQCQACKRLNKLYHPSLIEFIGRAELEEVETVDKKKHYRLQLGPPFYGSIKNPMLLRIMFTLRKVLNDLLANDYIDEDTRVVIEVAPEVNDANKSWAIATYQKHREEENKEFKSIIKSLTEHTSISAREDCDSDLKKIRLWFELADQNFVLKPKKDGHQMIQNDVILKRFEFLTPALIKESQDCKDRLEKKFRLWKEQSFRSIYTGNMISLTDLFSPNNTIEIEHTIPRSISFDDSLENLTVCESYFNANIKGKRLPSQLDNYNEVIMPNIQPWIERVSQIEDNINYWKVQSYKDKDTSIRQQHLWKMELDYWKRKIERFTLTEVKKEIRNNQLIDTRILSRYTAIYLKSLFRRVDVQNGKTTSVFRKIFDIQNIDDKKNRLNHSHHAIDATVLTMIPSDARRDEMIELFYLIQEAKGEEKYKLQDQLEILKRSYLYNYVGGINDFIEKNILVEHILKDQTLTPSSRRERNRGSIIPLRYNGKIVYDTRDDGSIIYRTDKFNNIIYKKDHQGNYIVANNNKVPIPKPKPKWIKGDSIRAQLHRESYYGAIKLPLVDKEGRPKVKSKTFEYGGSDISMVIRVPLDKYNFKNENDIEIIIDPNVKKAIRAAVDRGRLENKSFEKVISEPIFMLGKNGSEIKIDKNGRILGPIRHVRCRVRSGKGFFTEEKAIKVKPHIYKSNKQLVNIPSREYKEFVYAQNSGNYLCFLYESITNNKIERRVKLLTYFDVVKNRNCIVDNKLKEDSLKFKGKKKEFILSAILKRGMKVLLWIDSPKELIDMSNDANLHQRLYVINKFNTPSSTYIYLTHHNDAENTESDDSFSTSYNNENLESKIRLTPNNFNCLIEGKDFIIDALGKIVLNKND